MSLKAFHIFFIAASVLLAFGFGAWALYFYAADGELGNLLMGLGSIVIGVGLVIYGRKFLQKFKHVSSM